MQQITKNSKQEKCFLSIYKFKWAGAEMALMVWIKRPYCIYYFLYHFYIAVGWNSSSQLANVCIHITGGLMRYKGDFNMLGLVIFHTSQNMAKKNYIHPDRQQFSKHPDPTEKFTWTTFVKYVYSLIKNKMGRKVCRKSKSILNYFLSHLW